jgi:hypothetical protein
MYLYGSELQDTRQAVSERPAEEHANLQKYAIPLNKEMPGRRYAVAPTRGGIALWSADPRGADTRSADTLTARAQTEGVGPRPHGAQTEGIG